jgi:hypothetical protein
MENQSEKLDHQVAGLPSLCLAPSQIQFSVHTAARTATLGQRSITVSDRMGVMVVTRSRAAGRSRLCRGNLHIEFRYADADLDRLPASFRNEVVTTNAPTILTVLRQTDQPARCVPPTESAPTSGPSIGSNIRMFIRKI